MRALSEGFGLRPDRPAPTFAPPVASGSLQAFASSPSTFRDALEKANGATAPGDADRADSDVDPQVRKQVRNSAESLVAQTLIAPLLAQLRENNHAPEPFGVSEAEKRLGPVFDEHVAKSVVKRSQFNLVDSVERSILSRMSHEGAQS